jgi:hypothetical protein
MKNQLLLSTTVAIATLGALPAASHAAAIGGYDFGIASSGATLAPTSVAPGATFSNFAYTGTGTTNFPAGNPSAGGNRAFAANDFSDDSTITVNNTGNPDGFFSFSITPNAGNFVTINGITLDTKPNGNAAPTKLLIRSSLDGFASDLFNGNLGPKNDWTTITAAFASPLTSTSAISFRIYPFLTGPGNADNLDIDNVSVQGSVAPVPAPALLPGLIGISLGAFRKKKRIASRQSVNH